MFGELLKRIANQRRLTQSEEQRIEAIGNQLELDTSLTASIRDGSGELKTKSVTADYFLVGQRRIMDFFYMSNISSQTVPDNSNTQLTGWGPVGVGSNVINRGFAVENGKIYFPIDGEYFVRIVGNFGVNATGYRRIFTQSNTTYESDLYLGDNRVPYTAGTGVTVFCSGIGKFEAGKYLTIGAYQNSGGDLDVFGRIEVKLL